MIDWPLLVSDIAYLRGEAIPGTDRMEPLGTSELARSCALSRGALRNLLAGTEPRWSEGERLIRIWCSLTGKAASYAPLLRRLEQAKGRR